MPTTIILIDLLALVFGVTGFHVAFRQTLVLRWWARSRRNERWRSPSPIDSDEDPARYALRIAGVMLMAFSAAIGLLVTAFHTSNGGVS